MQLSDVREWKDQSWTRLYECALLEPDTVKLCACVWDAELAILSRQREIRGNATGETREQLALIKAWGVLSDLRHLSGFENHHPSLRRRYWVTSGAGQTRVHRSVRAAKRMTAGR
jgi:hypothetical protein